MEAGDPRQAAFEILRRVEHEGAYSSVLLQHVDGGEFPARDVALITELVYGVLRNRRRLDEAVASISSRPLERIDPGLLVALRLGFYQVIFLDRIPAHAAVNETVRLARRCARGRGASAVAFAAFANGLMRNLTRRAARLRAPRAQAAGEEPASWLAQVWSHPEWLVRRWMARFGGDETARLLAAANRPPPVALRVAGGHGRAAAVASHLLSEGVTTRRSRYLDDFLIVEEGVAQRTGAFRQGEFYIQDEASGLIARLAGAAQGDRVLDACAAPGGKALALAERVGAGGLVLAGDVHPSRLRLLGHNAARMKLPWCLAVAADLGADAFPFGPGVAFDIVIVDAPCTGTGVIRRNPELRDRIFPGDLDRIAAVQRRLLGSCARLVRPGGALVYSVCSLEPEEGPDQVKRFLVPNAGFTIDDPRPDLPEEARRLVESSGGIEGLVTLPHRDDLDGFFAVRFRRQR